jgi:hypothetical protein
MLARFTRARTSPVPTIPPPAPPRRRRALVELDARIDAAERTQVRCRLDIQDQAAAARSTARPTAALRMADERLALLRRSREVLLVARPDGGGERG